MSDKKMILRVIRTQQVKVLGRYYKHGDIVYLTQDEYASLHTTVRTGLKPVTAKKVKELSTQQVDELVPEADGVVEPVQGSK